MPSLTAARGVIAQYEPSYLPIAIFVGGTSGIGQHMAQIFANQTKGNAHIIIVGRNEAAAKSIISSFPKPSEADAQPGWKHEFVYCDAELMRNVYATTKALLERLTRVNFIVLSAGTANLRGREETVEGVDKKMATRYYARWAFIDGLLPLLKKARDVSEPASVMSILAAGMGPRIDLDNLDMKRGYTGLKVTLVTGTYNDMMMAELARREPDIVFTHIWPGVVNTEALRPAQWGLRLIVSVLSPLLWLLTESPENCAAYMLYGLLEGKRGINLRNQKGDDIGFKNYHGTDESQLKLWEHTKQVVSEANGTASASNFKQVVWPCLAGFNDFDTTLPLFEPLLQSLTFNPQKAPSLRYYDNTPKEEIPDPPLQFQISLTKSLDGGNTFNVHDEFPNVRPPIRGGDLRLPTNLILFASQDRTSVRARWITFNFAFPSPMVSSSTLKQPSPPMIVKSPHPDPLSWVPFTTRLALADFICYGHPLCVRYAIASWPESVLAADDWDDFGLLPATTPVMQTIVLRFPYSHFQLEVRASSHPHATIADVLRSIYTMRVYFPQARFVGLSPAGHNYLRVHLDN